MTRVRISLLLPVLLLSITVSRAQNSQDNAAPGRARVAKAGVLRLFTATEADIDDVDAKGQPIKLILSIKSTTKCDAVKVGDLVSVVYRVEGSSNTAVSILLQGSHASRGMAKTGPVGGVGGTASAKPQARPAVMAPKSPPTEYAMNEGLSIHSTTAGHTTTSTVAHSTTVAGGHATASGTAHGAGGVTVARGDAPSQHFSSFTPKGSTEHATKSGDAVRTRGDGHVSDVHDAKRGVDIHHGLDGSRTVSVARADGSRLVAERGSAGYVERSYGYKGHDYARRTFYYHGHEYDHFYRSYGYRGQRLDVYAPDHYFSPGFYGWAYNPWTAPIAYKWKWSDRPWYGYYGNFFTPYPIYPSASFWLTDYLIAHDLETDYASRQGTTSEAADSSPASGASSLTPDVKQMIAKEVNNQVALENSESLQFSDPQSVDPGSSGIARMLADGHSHVFVVGDDLDLIDSTGAECAVSEGDALQLVTPPAVDATTASLVVLASKGGKECQKAATVAVNMVDLQEMQNHLREMIDMGLRELQAKQGTDGLPVAPLSAQTPPIQSPYAAVAPPPDPKDAADLQAENKDADASEAAVVSEASSENGPPISSVTPSGSPLSVALGLTTDQVKAILGNPTKTANVGSKTIYYYDGMKVVFKAGKVTNVD